MSMQAESLEVLENADLPSSQARAIVRAIEIELAGAKDVLATKHDVILLRSEMATRNDIALLRGEMADLKADLRGEMGDLRGEMAVMRGDLRAEIHASVSGVTRQMYTALLGQMAVLLGFGYFFATHLAG